MHTQLRSMSIAPTQGESIHSPELPLSNRLNNPQTTQNLSAFIQNLDLAGIKKLAQVIGARYEP